MLVYQVGGHQRRHPRGVGERRPRGLLQGLRLVVEGGACVGLDLDEGCRGHREGYLPLGVGGDGHEPRAVGLRVLVEGGAAGGQVVGGGGAEQLQGRRREGREEDVRGGLGVAGPDDRLLELLCDQDEKGV